MEKTIYWGIVSLVTAVFAVAVFLGAIRFPRWLVAVLALLALPAALLSYVAFAGTSSNDKSTVLVFGGMFVLIAVPIAGVIGFFGAVLGKNMSDRLRASLTNQHSDSEKI